VTSLRRRLVLSLSAAILVVGLAAAAFTYFQVGRQTKELLDAQLRDVAAVASRAPEGPRNDATISVDVWDADGTLRYSSNPALVLPRSQPEGFSEVLLEGEPYRIYTTKFSDRRVAVAQAVDARDDQAEGAALAALAPVLLILPLLALTIAGLVTMNLHPVREAAREVARHEPLSKGRIELPSIPREIAPLVDEINRLLERQHQVMAQETAFLVDAAHALRTPLAALQLQVDVLDGSSDPLERQARIASLRAGIQRAARLSEQLLAAARTDDPDGGPKEKVALDEVLTEVCELYRSIADDAGVSLAAAVDSHALLRCNRRDLLLIFTNLLDNALRYAPKGSTVDVLSSSAGAMAQVKIRDQGPGLTATSNAEMVRSETSKQRRGFGLRAVESVTTRLGGTVTLRTPADGGGGLCVEVTFVVDIPDAPVSSHCLTPAGLAVTPDSSGAA
jgi:two-component system, OmpR family, sensor kinase